MKGRLIIAIISTVLVEVALAAGVLWGLPKLDIHIPLWVLIIAMVAWIAYAVTTYRMGSRALKKRPIAGLIDMLGSEGKAVSSLTPEGMVRINGELWRAKSTSGRVDTGEQVTVVGQDRLKLIVCKRSPDDLEETK